MAGGIDVPAATRCTCLHPFDCYCECHSHACDAAERVCGPEFMPDDGGFTPLGCPDCTPGAVGPHLAGCPTLAR